MRVLFLCTAHNSLSQRLYLALSRSHEVTIEYALSDDIMLKAVALAKPDLVLCPFLTTLVPKEIYENFMTLIVHPGAPGDAGPSSIEWLLLGDDGSIEDPAILLRRVEEGTLSTGRSRWAVTVLQAIEEFDAGPIWAFDQFSVNINDPKLTKSSLYRGDVTQAAIAATLAAIQRIEHASASFKQGQRCLEPYSPGLKAKPEYGQLSVSDRTPFQGGATHVRPLLRASFASFDTTRHTAQQISRRIRCADSQPGTMSKIFGPNLYLYGGLIDDTLGDVRSITLNKTATKLLAVRDGAVCISAADGKGVWISHIRRPKTKNDKSLWPKVPAVSGLMEMGILSSDIVDELTILSPANFAPTLGSTYQEVWVRFAVDEYLNKTAYLHFEFYNGAMSTSQCSRLIEAMDYILNQAAIDDSIRAVVLMGGSYFSNGIALNVIEAAVDPAQESWLNINRIDDVVQYLLHEFPSRNILTVAAMRGNAAAGGVALATACDFVIAGAEVVLNPAYRAVGLYGSEYHTISYHGRCGEAAARNMLTAMLPMSPLQARRLGLIDFIFPGTGAELDEYITSHVTILLKDGIVRQGHWKRNVDLSLSALAAARANELAEMSKDFWSPRSTRYHTRRFDFVRKTKVASTPLRFATHRRLIARPDEEETSDFDNVDIYRLRAEENLLASLRASIMAEIKGTMANGHLNGDTRVSKKVLEFHVPAEFPLTPPPIEDRPCLFSCHYEPSDPMLTPPESPMPLYLPDTDRSKRQAISR